MIFGEFQEDLMTYLHTRDIQLLNSWSFDEYNKRNYEKANKIYSAKHRMIKRKMNWIEKGMIGRFIYKYLGI